MNERFSTNNINLVCDYIKLLCKANSYCDIEFRIQVDPEGLYTVDYVLPEWSSERFVVFNSLEYTLDGDKIEFIEE